MKNKACFLSIIVSIVLLFVGISVEIPSDQLTTYSFQGDQYTEIEEYVGGDAYNYIIGAALVGGQIAGATISKAVYISIGLLLFCIGALVLDKGNKAEEESSQDQDNPDN